MNEQDGNFADRYFAAIRNGAESYADVLNALRAAGLVAEFTQTGGMCAALYVTTEDLPDGWHVLLGDSENGPISWGYEDPSAWSWSAGCYTDEEWIDDLDFFDDGHPATPGRAVFVALEAVQRLTERLS